MKTLGERMKDYEGVETLRAFAPLLPVCVRLDGKNFSKFTKGLEQPYDKRLSNLMIQTSFYLAQEANAVIAYTQSDEISLALYGKEDRTKIFFDGKIQKIISTLASMATAYFNSHIPKVLPEKEGVFAFFDCRAWQLPSLEEAANVFLWRELDAEKNSISMAARCQYSHEEINKKSGEEKKKMLLEKGIDWEDYPEFFKRGTFLQRRKILRKFTTPEIEKLPPKHDARLDPEFEVERSEIKILPMPPFLQVKNRVGVLFRNEEPIVENENH